MIQKLILLLCLSYPFISFGQLTVYPNYFDYKNINTQTFIPMQGWNNEQKYMLTILKHSFDMQHIISHPKDTVFVWNGLIGKKTIYTKDSLMLFFIRPADTITRPCILLTHGNNAKYRSSWNEFMNFYTIDLVMRGYCVAYYENPSSADVKEISASIENNFSQLLSHARNAFYNGFQSSVAADIFVKHNASILKIDTTKIFAGGYSFGAFCSAMLASADNGKNFTDTIFSEQGSFNAKSIYNDVYTKNISRAFCIGGGLPKDDTTALNNSRMGNFLGNEDALSLLFFHGRTDNFISFDLTKVSDSANATDYFFAEGPRALINNIQHQSLSIGSKLFTNCRSGHSFITAVCGYSNPYCLPQFQWQYLPEPPNDLSSTNPYFATMLTDTLLHYFVYMMTQLNDIGFIVGDFLQPSVLNTPSAFPNKMFYIEPRDSFTYANSSGHFILKTTDCEGHVLVITSTKENISTGKKIKIFPNPTNGFITFETNEIIEDIGIYNLLGERINEITTNNTSSQQIDMGNLSSGEYIAVIRLKNELLTQKISVLH